MNPVELVIGLILVAAVLATLARRVGVPYPVFLVLGGLVLGFVPGLPRVDVPPDVVFLVFIPPLVYMAASQVTLRDFRENLRPILLLAVGLVLATLVFVAGVTTWSVDGFGWATAFVLAAIIGPTDTVAITAVTEGMPIPRRIGTILEGESLINDIVALVAYKLAVDAVTSGSISFAGAGLYLLWGSTAGIAVGLLVGVLAVWVRRLLVDDPTVSIAVSLLTGFAAFLGAEAIGASGILATVTAGFYVGRQLSKILSPEGRVQAFSFWATISFLLQGLAFVLIGLELRTIVDDLEEFSLGTLLTYGAIVSAAVIGLRLFWVFSMGYPTYWLMRLFGSAEPFPPWKNVFVVGWAGMRGVDSLAAALALPLTFPKRNLIVFLSFSVILATLILQGLGLPLLLRWLKLNDEDAQEREEAHARLAASTAALQQLETHISAAIVPAELLAQVRTLYEKRLQCAQAQLNPAEYAGCDDALAVYHRLRRDLLNAERRAIIELRELGIISHDVLRRIERSLDYEELRLEG